MAKLRAYLLSNSDIALAVYHRQLLVSPRKKNHLTSIFV